MISKSKSVSVFKVRNFAIASTVDGSSNHSSLGLIRVAAHVDGETSGSAVYNSVKLSFALIQLPRNVSPLLSFAVDPTLMTCCDISIFRQCVPTFWKRYAVAGSNRNPIRSFDPYFGFNALSKPHRLTVRHHNHARPTAATSD